MMLEAALWTFLHILVFVYWLGGDLGAFYSSHFLTRPGVSADRRLMAAKIVGDVDMAPRTALILAFPTGLMLAIAKGWIAWPDWIGWAVMAAGVAWLALAWWLHLAHGKDVAWPRRLDLAIRVGLAMWLFIYGFSALIGNTNLPGFLALKMWCLAGAIVMGLLIRQVLAPLGPALAGLAGEAAAAEAQLATTLRRARPLVMVIWVLISAAALLGLWMPAI